MKEDPTELRPTAGLHERFPHLSQPLSLGPVLVRNRTIVTAHTTNLAASHEVSDRHLAYHRRRAAGGFGLIITEGLRVHPTSLRRPETLSIWSDEVVPSLSTLVDVVHSEGAAIVAQILHSGREAADDYTRIPSWGPSALAWSRGAPAPHAMDEAEIEELIDCYAAAASRAAAAGFDGLEVHIGHGHLLQQFLSPATNLRDDAWGGDRPRRLALIDSVLSAIEAAIPRSRMALGIRISADEFLEGGLDVEDMAPITRTLVEDHGLDFVNVSHSAYVGAATLSTQIADMAFGSTPFAHLPAAIRAAIPGTPVLAACRIETLEQGELLVESGVADAVALTRASIAEPALVMKGAAGERIRRCTSCNQLCIGRTSTGLPLSCVVNPEVGLEERWASARSELRAAIEASGGHRPRILVVGSGPAGLEAALSAAPFADVTVIDRDSEIGGSLRLAARLRNRAGWFRLIEDLTAECAREVRIALDTEFDVAASSDFDGIVLATGAAREPRVFGVRSGIPVERIGVDEWEHRIGSGELVVVHDDHGSWPGLAAVEHLLATGAEVHYVTPLAAFAPQITIYSRYGLIERLKAARVRIHLGTTLDSWEDDGTVRLVDGLTGLGTDIGEVRHLFDVGAAASRIPALPRPASAIVGDAYAPRDAGHAVWSGRIGGLRAVTRIVVADPDERHRIERMLMALPLAPVRTARELRG